MMHRISIRLKWKMEIKNHKGLNSVQGEVAVRELLVTPHFGNTSAVFQTPYVVQPQVPERV